MPNRALLLVALLSLAGPVAAKSKDEPSGTPPAALVRLFSCRTIGDTAARLACFDREAASLATAQSAGELIAMDRQQVRATRRSLFGLALPNLGVFGDNSVDANSGILETTITRATRGPDSKWTFDLAEGGRWIQLDRREFIVDPAPGQPIRVRRGAMGSYLANVDKQFAIRIERVR